MKNAWWTSYRVLVGLVVLYSSLVVGRGAGIDDLSFEAKGPNSVVVTRCEKSAAGTLILPSEFEGKKVVEIGSGAFSLCESLTAVVIPDCVETIGERAFEECKNLEGIRIPASVVSIGDSAFNGCTTLRWVTFDGNAPTLAKENGTGPFMNISPEAEIFVREGRGGFGEDLFGVPVVVIGQDPGRADLKVPVSLLFSPDFYDDWPTELAIPTGEKVMYFSKNGDQVRDYIPSLPPGVYRCRFAYATEPGFRGPVTLSVGV